MELKQYQKTAVKQLVEYTKKYLKGNAKPIYLVAPTGAGKTVIASGAMEEIAGSLQYDYDCNHKQVAFIWIAPNKLQLQSYDSMKSYFKYGNNMHAIKWDEVDHSIGHLEHGDVLFLNWASIDKEDNVIWKDTETHEGLQSVIDGTKENNIHLVLVIDEEHLNANAPRASEVMARIAPDVVIRISATPKLPKSLSDYTPVPIYREDVVKEQMIKKDVIINAGLEVTEDIVEETAFFIETALKRLAELREAYARIGSPVKPLLLIQLPNDNKALSAQDKAKVEEVKGILAANFDITENNEKLAIWLSEEKSPHLDSISDPQSLTEVLIFKEAISKGWDCPRAAVLLIFRENMGYSFTVQTVGRILRMPQQKYYSDDALNHGYVYINTQNDHIEIKSDAEQYELCLGNYESVLRRLVHPISLPSTTIGITRVQNALNYRFRKILRKTIIDEWQLGQLTLNFGAPDLSVLDPNNLPSEEVSDGFPTDEQKENRGKLVNNAHLDLDVHRLYSVFPKDMTVDTTRTGVYEVSQNNRASLAKTEGDIDRLFCNFCLANLIRFDKRDSLSAMQQAIFEFMRDYAGYNDKETKRIVLFHKNRSKFVSVLQKAQERYIVDMQDRMKQVQSKPVSVYWSIPTVRTYKTDTHTRIDAPSHALQPYYELKNASEPETRFRDFLNRDNENIMWWYKNGDSGKENFSILYTKSDGSKGNFYVDYIIMLRNGRMCLFDTKSLNGGIGDSVEKHNALVDYVDKLNEANGTNIIGGIIIEDNGQWLYSPMHISDAGDHAGWSVFNPEELNEVRI